jgi:hypothetical protein
MPVRKQKLSTKGRLKIMKMPTLNITPAGIAVGAGAVLLAPLVLPVATRILRSATKFGMKTAMLSYDRGKKVLSDGKDAITNITSETKSEISKPAKKPTKKGAAAA